MDNKLYGIECTNCMGELNISEDPRFFVCPYCGSRYVNSFSDKFENEKNAGGHKVSNESFLICKLSPNVINKHSMASIVALNEFAVKKTSVDQYIEMLTKIASNNDFTACNNTNGSLLQIIMNAIKLPHYPNEKIIFFKSDGILKKEKSGILISDKAVYFLKNNCYHSLLLEKIESLSVNAYVNEWRLNGISYAVISNMNCKDDRELAVYLGVICELAMQKHTGDFQIKINNIYR